MSMIGILPGARFMIWRSLRKVNAMVFAIILYQMDVFFDEDIGLKQILNH